MHKIVFVIPAAFVLLSGCSGPKPDQMRTVKSYQVSSCDSTPTTDALELAALDAFKVQIQYLNFVRRANVLIAANHESSAEASGLREYQGPFYLYLHPRAVAKLEAREGIEWIATAYLHANKVRTRLNGGEWSSWQRVRTRNFINNAPTVDGLTRWKCLIGAEIAWAEVAKIGNTWRVDPQSISVYDAGELERLHPLATPEQIAGKMSIQAMHLNN